MNDLIIGQSTGTGHQFQARQIETEPLTIEGLRPGLREKKLDLADLKFERIVTNLSSRLGKEFIADIRISEDEIAKAYFMDIRFQVYVLGIGDRIIKYPDGWIQAAKDRWFPPWLKRQFPVKYKIFDAFAYWPTLHKYLPDALKGAPGGAMFRKSTGGLE